MSARRVWSAVGAGWVGLQGRGLRPEQREVGTEWKCILSVGEAGRADVELRSALVLDYRIWRPRERVTMLYGDVGPHRALGQI
jgi:hypothetical protein